MNTKARTRAIRLLVAGALATAVVSTTAACGADLHTNYELQSGGENTAPQHTNS